MAWTVVAAGLTLVSVAWEVTAQTTDPEVGPVNAFYRLMDSLESVGSSVRDANDTDDTVRYQLTEAGFLRNLCTAPTHYFALRGPRNDDPETTARQFLEEHRVLLGVSSSNVAFNLVRTLPQAGRHAVRFEQRYRDIPVFGGQTIVQVDDAGGVAYVLSDIARHTAPLDDGSLSTDPTLPSVAASNQVVGLLREEYPGVPVQCTEPTLEIFSPEVLGLQGPLQLVWRVRSDASASHVVHEQVLVDAHNGRVVRRYPLNVAALDREVFDASNTTADPGTSVRAEGDGPAGLIEANEAYDYLGDTYDFYDTHHQRDSINDGGMTLSLTVRFCRPDGLYNCPMENAYWSGGQERIYFGEGRVADDVVAHEYTHGVTGHESDLIYENHSGAINESFSDVWGEFVDLENGAGNDHATNRWLFGEDKINGYSRNMADPPDKSDPDRLGSPLFTAPVGNPDQTNDWGGVHSNNGVNNKLCYLLTDGDTFNGETVAGQGLDRVAELYYEVQTSLLASGADYIDLYHALQQAAANLGWSSARRNAVYHACVAVEIAQAHGDVYVDGSYSGTEQGTESQPFNSVEEAYDAAYPGDRLHVKSGQYAENLVFDKVLTVTVWGTGGVTIGD